MLLAELQTVALDWVALAVLWLGRVGLLFQGVVEGSDYVGDDLAPFDWGLYVDRGVL